MFWFCTFAFQGKTRTLLEALSWSFGIYLESPDSEAKTADPLWTEGPSGGSLDLQILCESVYEAIQRYTQIPTMKDKPRKLTSMASFHFSELVTLALHLLIRWRLQLLRNLQQLDTSRCTPYHWLLFQLALARNYIPQFMSTAVDSLIPTLEKLQEEILFHCWTKIELLDPYKSKNLIKEVARQSVRLMTALGVASQSQPTLGIPSDSKTAQTAGNGRKFLLVVDECQVMFR
jgi:hypothetical protein